MEISKVTSKFIKFHEDSNPEKFNEDLMNLKEKDNEYFYLDLIFRSLEDIEGIKYEGLKEIPYKVFNEKKYNKEKDIKITIDTSQSVLKMYRASFTIRKDGKEAKKDIELYYPKMLKGGRFLINSVKYVPILQMLDSGFFNTSDTIVLKTMMSIPIRIRLKQEMLLVDMFKNKIPVHLYFLAKFGFEETIKKFEYKDKVFVKESNTITEEDKNNFEIIEINKKMSVLFRNDFYYKNKTECLTFFECFNNKRISLEQINTLEFWKKRLGGYFSTSSSNKIKKCNSILFSLERNINALTKRHLYIDEKYKEDIYGILLYMTKNFKTLLKENNLDLTNKRLRCHEYICYPLQLKFNTYLYRINNSTTVTFEKLCKFPTISKGFLIKRIVKNNKLLRYDSSFNSISILSKLKFTQNGPQSQFDKGSVNIVSRTLHPSFIGRIDLLATSASDPGCSGSIVPFAKFDENMHFL